MLPFVSRKLTRRSIIAQCEPVTLITTPNFEQPQFRDSTSKIQDISEAASPHLSNKEFECLTKPLTEYEDIFAVNSDDHGRTNKVYHRINTWDARPIPQPPRRLPLAKQTEVSGMLDDMQRRGVIEESDSLGCPQSFWSGRRMENSVSVLTTEN
jgi:hypothetical protein